MQFRIFKGYLQAARER